MALFDFENPEVGGGIDIIEELAGMAKPETDNLPETDKQRLVNLEKFRKYGYKIDQSIQDAFVTMKTERFSYKSKGVTKKYSRLVPIFDLSKAGGKTIEELNAKIYGDNADKVLARKWKGGFVGVMENGKVVYKSWKSMNFSSINLREPNTAISNPDEATKKVISTPKTVTNNGQVQLEKNKTPENEWVQKEQTGRATVPNFNEWVSEEKNGNSKVKVPMESKVPIVASASATKSNTTNQSSDVLDAESEMENLIKRLGEVLDWSEVDPSDYLLLEKVGQKIYNLSDHRGKILQVVKGSRRSILTNKEVSLLGDYIDLSQFAETRFNTDMEGGSLSDHDMVFTYDKSLGKFKIKFIKTEDYTRSNIKPKTNDVPKKTSSDVPNKPLEKNNYTQQFAKKDTVSNVKNKVITQPDWKPDPAKLGRYYQSVGIVPTNGNQFSLAGNMLENNSNLNRSFISIINIFKKETFSNAQKDRAKTQIVEKGTDKKGYNRSLLDKQISLEMSNNGIINDSLKNVTLNALDIKVNSKDPAGTTQKLIAFFDAFMQIKD